MTSSPLLDEATRATAAGDALFEVEKYDEAIPFFERAIELYVEAMGANHERVAVATNRLANTYYRKKDDVEATCLFERALKIREAVLPPDHPDLRLSVNNLANCYRNRRRWALAEPLYRRSFAMLTAQTGHADHVPVMKNLALVLEAQHKTDEASALRERIAILEASSC